jgi:hypothetical protein
MLLTPRFSIKDLRFVFAVTVGYCASKASILNRRTFPLLRFRNAIMPIIVETGAFKRIFLAKSKIVFFS